MFLFCRCNSITQLFWELDVKYTVFEFSFHACLIGLTHINSRTRRKIHISGGRGKILERPLELRGLPKSL